MEARIKKKGVHTLKPHARTGLTSSSKAYAVRFSREDWAKTLVITTLLTLFGAVAIDLLNVGNHGLRSLVFVGPTLALIAALFWFFPSPHKLKIYLRVLQSHRFPKQLRLASKFTEKKWLPRVVPLNLKSSLKNSVQTPSRIKPQKALNMASRSSLKLWSDSAPRLNINLFESNVPTFVLTADQHIVDWNVGFDLAFGSPLGLKRGHHVSEWFNKLDNFKKVAKRQDQLYGEAVLPITDRERASFKHPKYGRMVYTKIMSPIIDLKTSKIIGWTIVLNINSVNKRKEFFEDLFHSIQEEGRKIRYRAAYPDVFKHYEGRRNLLKAHINKTHSPLPQKKPHNLEKVLIWGPDSVALTSEYMQLGYHVTVFSDDVHLLRRVKSDFSSESPSVRLVRKESHEDLPECYFDKASVMFDTGSLEHYQTILNDVYRALKAGGSLSLSAITDAEGLERIFKASFEALQGGGHLDEIKHQFHHVREYALGQCQASGHVVLDRIMLRNLALEAGFIIAGESELHQEATTTLLELKKSF